MIKKCENCGIHHNGEYGSGRFCTSKCARSFSTKKNKKEINDKISKSLTGKSRNKTHETIITLKCLYCLNDFTVKWNKRKQKTCSFSCAGKLKWLNQDYKTYQVLKIKERCSNPEERNRLRDIGRKGGFGTKGITKNGTHFQSKLEKECFEYLENNNILFEAHKHIPNSSKISDVFLVEYNKWLEIDGINREKKKSYLGKDYDYWLDKLNIYQTEGLDLTIIYSIDDLKKLIER